MKRIVGLLVALICLTVFPAASLAETSDTSLFSPALDAMIYLDGEEFEEGYSEYYMTEDGLISVEILTVEATGYGLVGEGSFEDFLTLRAEGDMRETLEVECEAIGSYPAQRIRFETGANEDSVVVDATAIWTDAHTFVYIVTANIDAWYGFMDVYEEGAVQAMVDEWISELQINGCDWTDDPELIEEALPEICLVSPALTRMTYLEGEVFDEGSCELYMSEDALIFVEVLSIDTTEYGMIGEGSFAEFMELREESEIEEILAVECEGISFYPAQRIRFETGENEDLAVVDATAVWTDSKTFVYIVTIDADAWYGFVENYEEGAAQAMVDEWIAELQIEGYASDEWDFAETSVVLIADRSCGIADAGDLGMVERYEAMIEGEFDANALADGLSVLTGLDFLVDCYFDEEIGFVVDWQLDSTLIAGLDDREQNEDFFFHDAVSLNWFMMDSLYATICENLGVEEVYYTMDGGRELEPTELGILNSLPTNVPYMGSAFYFAHSDVIGDEEDSDDSDSDLRAELGIGSLDAIMDTEFFRVVIPAFWRDLYDCDIVQNEPFGYTITFSEKESGFVFSLEARWFDDEVVQLESVWQGYLGRLNVERLGALDLLVIYSQPAPDASDAWQTMYDTCRDIVDILIMQEGVTLEEGEYIDYQP